MERGVPKWSNRYPSKKGEFLTAQKKSKESTAAIWWSDVGPALAWRRAEGKRTGLVSVFHDTPNQPPSSRNPMLWVPPYHEIISTVLFHQWTFLTPRSGSTVYLTVSYNRYPFLSAYDRELSCQGANWALSLTRFVSLSKGNFYTFSLWSLDAHSQQLSLSWNLSPLSISRFPEIRWKLQRRIG